MNKKALIDWFQRTGIPYEINTGGIIIFTDELSNRTIREIGACNGRLKFGAEVMVVNDD